MRLIQITDMHLCREPGDIKRSGVNTDESLAAVLACIAENEGRPDLLAATGDLVQHPHPDVYGRFENLVSLLQIPVVTIPGNHDDGVMMAGCFGSEQMHFCGDHSLGNWDLLFFDTSVPEKAHGHLDERQLTELAERMGSSSADHLMIFLHHQPHPVGCEWLDGVGLRNSDAFWSTISKSDRVRGVVCGHIHQQMDVERDGIRVLGTPSTCVQFIPYSDDSDLDDKPPAYRVIKLNDDGSIDTRVEWVPLD
jgi:Icc protein